MRGPSRERPTTPAAAVLVAAVLAAFVATPVSAGETRGEAAWVDWATERSLALDPTDWPLTAPAQLGALAKDLDQARVVYLGEPDHYITEKYDYRLLFIRTLMEQGYRYLGMEMGLSDGMRIDRYLETGDERYLDRVALYGYRGDARVDRESVPAVIEAMTGEPFFDGFVSAERAFLRELREINVSLEPGEERLHWFGWDIDVTVPGAGYVEASEILEPFRGVAVIEELEARLALVPAETFTQEAERLGTALAFMADRADELQSVLGRADANLLRHVVRNLADSLRFRGLAYREPFGSHWNEAMGQREEALIARLDAGWLTRLEPDDRFVLMGHNMHLSKDPSTLRSGSSSDGVLVGMWPTVGGAIAERLPVYSVWMLYDHGTSVRVFDPDPVFDVPSDPDHIEHLLALIAPVLFLPLDDDDPRAAWLDQDRDFGQNGDDASGLLRRQADAIFFVEEVNAVGSGSTESG